MSSSSKTPKIQLNQWVASDPVLRDDFNSDNLKIDTAFQGIDSRFGSANSSISALGAAVLAVPYEKIVEHTFNATVARVDIDLGVDLWSYSRVFITVSMISNRSTITIADLILNGMTNVYGQPLSNYPNHDPYSRLTYIGIGASNAQSALSTIELNIMKDPPTPRRVIMATMRTTSHNNQGYQTLSFDGGLGVYETDSTAPIDTINFKCNDGSLIAGGSILIYGVKL